jgi:hypothetical protein
MIDEGSGSRMVAGWWQDAGGDARRWQVGMYVLLLSQNMAWLNELYRRYHSAVLKTWERCYLGAQAWHPYLALLLQQLHCHVQQLLLPVPELLLPVRWYRYTSACGC